MRKLAPSLLTLLALFGTLFLLLPPLALVLHISWDNVWSAWQGADGSPLWTSIWTTCLSMLVVTLVGTPFAWLLARRRGLFWQACEYLLLIPMLLPPLVIGLLLIYSYGPYSLIGKFLESIHISATNSALAVIIAQTYEALPYYVFAAEGAFMQVDPGMERVSAALGASPFRTFRRITLPLAWPGLSVGLAIAFSRAIGAFGAVIVIAYNPQTLPVSIWVALQEQGLQTALPLALLLLAVALPLPLIATLWRRIHDAGLET
ncbi:MAG: ABC transporter permease subunit [Peptococcaceae bacterium]|nr:ABC transporter permease subunit [Peptococcaceae bacterium]